MPINNNPIIGINRNDNPINTIMPSATKVTAAVSAAAVVLNASTPSASVLGLNLQMNDSEKHGNDPSSRTTNHDLVLASAKVGKMIPEDGEIQNMQDIQSIKKEVEEIKAPERNYNILCIPNMNPKTLSSDQKMQSLDTLSEIDENMRDLNLNDENSELKSGAKNRHEKNSDEQSEYKSNSDKSRKEGDRESGNQESSSGNLNLNQHQIQEEQSREQMKKDEQQHQNQPAEADSENCSDRSRANSLNKSPQNSSGSPDFPRYDWSRNTVYLYIPPLRRDILPSFDTNWEVPMLSRKEWKDRDLWMENVG
jgi:hypothetical protein